MKKVLISVLAIIILAVSLLPAAAAVWDTPELMLATDYNMEKQTITLYYRVLNLAGTESADFRLRYNPDIVEYVSHEASEMSNVFTEIGHQADNKDTIAIQFVDLYYVEPEDCEEDGSATIATFTFRVIDKKAAETVFIAFADSCAMDPESTEVFVERTTHKISINSQSEQKATHDGFTFPEVRYDDDNANIKKIVIAAIISAVVLVGGIIVIVVKYRKKK